MELARLCRQKHQYVAAVRFIAEAFASDSKLASDLHAQRRFQAACSAALAAAGQGEDAAKLDDSAKAKLRNQALNWLKADLDALAILANSGSPQAQPFIERTLSHWQENVDLTSLRVGPALAKLPAEEQKAFTQLWADVAALLKKLNEKPK